MSVCCYFVAHFCSAVVLPKVFTLSFVQIKDKEAEKEAYEPNEKREGRKSGIIALHWAAEF